MSSSAQPVRVHLEFKRVQTFLFDVPRMRVMIGANVLLGEALRYELLNVYRETQPNPPDCLSQTDFQNLFLGNSGGSDKLDEALENWNEVTSPFNSKLKFKDDVDRRQFTGYLSW